MEPEGSLTHSQIPATLSYPETDRSNPYPHIPLPEDPTYYYPLIHAWIFQVVSFPNKTLYTPLISPIRATCPTHLIILDLITRTILGEANRSLGS